jgi:Ca-activated chloride channel family protein
MWVARSSQPAQPSQPAPPSSTQSGQTQASPVRQAPAAGQTIRTTDNFKIVTSVNEVNLIFTVTDKHGNFIPNLKQSDFALLDDQKAPARFLRLPSRPICLCA